MEILVVILIIAILASLLFPAFAKAQEKGRQTTCSSNLHQVQMAIGIWSQDHKDTFPTSDTVWNDIKVSKRILVCPSKPRMAPVGYAYSTFIADKPESLVTEPTEEIVVADGANRTFTNPTDLDFRHNDGYFAAYVDGHAQWRKDLPPMWYVELTTMAEYDTSIKSSTCPTVVLLYTTTPDQMTPEYAISKTLAPHLTAIAQRYRLRVRFVGVNCDNFPELEQTYSIQRGNAQSGYPTVILAEDGREVKRFGGYPADWANKTQKDWDLYCDALEKQIDAAIDDMLKIK